MATGIVKLDINMILNMIKNDRKFEVTNGVPRDAYPVASEYCEKGKILIITVESKGIEKDGSRIDVEVFGNADAVDETGALKEIKPVVEIQQ